MSKTCAISYSQKKTPSFGLIAKVIMDRLCAALGLFVLAPLFIVLIFLIRRDGGPAFYTQPRLGKDGKIFQCWKFRSMIMNADAILQDLMEKDPAVREEYTKFCKLKNDPRITKTGHFLRKTSIDELPQLFNVLKGEMSLVGPRPILVNEASYFGEKITDYYAVRPGITGLWQISGRNETTFEERVTLDTHYVHQWSFWGDIVILFKTVLVVFGRKGAY